MSRHTKHLINLVTICLIISAGAIFRLWDAETSPLWLDEHYSLFYASDLNHLRQFTESHLPTYYVALSLVQQVTTNIAVLRGVTSVFPSVLAIILITFFTYFQQKSSLNNPWSSYRTAALLSLNPFLISLSWQLRMYGLVMLATTCQYILQALLLQKKSASQLQKIIWLMIGLLLTNLVDYSLIISSFFVFLYALLQLKLTLKHKVGWLVGFSLACSGQILIGFSSLNLKQQLIYSYSWIPHPTWSNIPATIFELMGFGQLISLGIVSQALFYFLLLTLVGWLVFHYQKKLSTLYTSELAILFFLPVISLLFISLLLPWLSHRYYIHQFVPSISLFLPRILLPFGLFFLFHLPRQKPLITKFTSSFLGVSYLVISLYQQSQPAATNISYELSSNFNELAKDSTVTFPAWVILPALTPSTLTQVDQVAAILARSEPIEQSFYSLAKTNNLDLICTQLTNSQVVVKKNQNEYIQSANQKFIHQIEKCCQPSLLLVDHTIYSCP